MVDSVWSYVVTLYDINNSWSSRVITDDVLDIPRFTDSNDGQVNTAEITISADKGKNIKTNTINNGDRINIAVVDGDGGVYTRFFEVVRKVPVKVKHGGTKLRLELEGIERWLQKINYAKPHDFSTPKQVVIDIVNHYNDNKGSLLPTLTIGTNDLPDKGVFRYDFSLNEDTCWNRLYEVIESMGAASTSGGVLDFYEAEFIAVAEMNITLNIFSSGSTGSSVVLESDNVNTGDQDGGLDEKEGTVVNSWGGTEDGSLPVEYSIFRSRQEILPTSLASDSQFPAFDTGERPYPRGAIVTYNSSVWVSNIDNNNDTPGTNWTLLTPETYYGGTVNTDTGRGNIEYSPWTHNKAAHIRNSGADPKATTWPFSGTAKARMWDINMIINDDTTFCADVDLIAYDSNLTTTDPDWLYDNTTPYDGLTVLVKGGTAVNDFAGHDNKIMEYNNGSWRVKYTPETNWLCSVYDTAQTFEFNGASWVEATTDNGGSWCFHPYDSIGQAEGVMIDADTGNEFIGNNVGSAVKVTYSWQPQFNFIEAGLSYILPTINWANTPEYYSQGAWINIRFPFPINTYNGITSGSVGDTYGGSVSENIVPVIDARNMHLSADGKRGFNKGSSSEHFGPLSSLDFAIKLAFLDNGNNAINKGNFKMRCGIIDLSDHVVYQDFVISHNDNWQPVKLPLSAFQIYRGRRPRFSSGFLGDVFPPKGIPSDEKFEWRNIKGIVIQTQESYDENGRYVAGKFGQDSYAAIGEGTVSVELSLDALRFTKPLLVNTGEVSTDPKEIDFLQRTDISNYEQLRMDALSELEKKKFPLIQYDVQTTGKFDINFGDSYFFEDDEIVYITDTLQSGETTSKVKLVAKYIEYSITKPDNGEGGFTRRIRGARRFV